MASANAQALRLALKTHMSADPIEINLGAEYDEELRAAVLGAFADLGATLTEKLMGLDVSIFETDVDGRTITVTAETTSASRSRESVPPPSVWRS